jgi:hypothetical protein
LKSYGQQPLCFMQLEGWQGFTQRVAMPLAKGDFVDLNWGVCYGSPIVYYECRDAERVNGF